MRASQRPGASISAGVGQLGGRVPEASEAVGAGALDDTVDEGRTALHLLARQREAEQATHEAVGRVALDPSSPQRLGEHAVGREDLGSDAVHHVIGDADHEGNERIELRHEGILRGRAGRAEEHLGVGERGLQPGHALRVAEIEATEAIFERPRDQVGTRRRTRA